MGKIKGNGAMLRQVAGAGLGPPAVTLLSVPPRAAPSSRRFGATEFGIPAPRPSLQERWKLP